jgi:hypothetical protein
MAIEISGNYIHNNGVGIHVGDSVTNNIAVGEWTKDIRKLANQIGIATPGVSALLDLLTDAPQTIIPTKQRHLDWFVATAAKISEIAKSGADAAKALSPLAITLWAFMQ